LERQATYALKVTRNISRVTRNSINETKRSSKHRASIVLIQASLTRPYFITSFFNGASRFLNRWLANQRLPQGGRRVLRCHLPGESGLLAGDDLAARWFTVDCAAPSRATDILALILAARSPSPAGSGDPDSRTRKLSPEDVARGA